MSSGGLPNRTLVAILVVVVVLIAVSPLSPLKATNKSPERTVEDVSIVQPSEQSSTLLWPYTSRSRSFGTATLPINAIVQTDAATTYQLLRTAPGKQERLYWDENVSQWQASSTAAGNVTVNGTGVYWGESAGSERYTYTLTNGTGRWADATYQLHDGTYFGSRYHLRLYESGSPDSRWTAIQAHHEHWDWFRLSHEVTSVSRAQHYLERDFMGTGLVRDMRRERWGNGGALDADGWVTVIEPRNRFVTGAQFAEETPSGIAPLLGLVSGLGLTVVTAIRRLRDRGRAVRDELRESRLTASHVALAGLTAAIPLVVRHGAIAVERIFPLAPPKLVGAPFYLLLTLGLPVVALSLGRHLSRTDGFTMCVVGFGTGIMLDYSLLGLTIVPYGALIQRIVLAIGLGILAAGGRDVAAQTMPRFSYQTVGLVIWFGMLVWPLLN